MTPKHAFLALAAAVARLRDQDDEIARLRDELDAARTTLAGIAALMNLSLDGRTPRRPPGSRRAGGP